MRQHSGQLDGETLRNRLVDLKHRIGFIRLYLQELRNHPQPDPEHEAALLLTIAAEKRALDQYEKLKQALEDSRRGASRLDTDD